MQSLKLTEWKPTELSLTPAEALAIRALPAHLDVQLVGAPATYKVTPGSFVGAIATTDAEVIIRPKVGIHRLFLLLGYAAGLRFREETTDLDEEQGLVEAFVAAYLHAFRTAMRRGPLMGYRSIDDSMAGVRGRIRVADQVRRRFAFPTPLEVTYDDYTVDIDENRVVKSAMRRLSQMRLKRSELRSDLAEGLAILDTVTDVRYGRRSVPRIVPTRLSEHYRTLLELSRLVLGSTTVELRSGKYALSGFLVNMNQVFEDFVYAALGERLGRRAQWRHGTSLYLDVNRRVALEPDISLWDGSRCVFVGDAKYKTTMQGENDDIYQLLAYCEAAGLREGLLIYANAPHLAAVHEVVHRGTRLRIEGVDLSAPESALLARMQELAELVRAMAGTASASSHAIGLRHAA
jgi:5-methylcytosine-specific restriction enzyme subunit McrC